MKEELKDIRDDQIRIIGAQPAKDPMPRWVWVLLAVLVAAGLVVGLHFFLQTRRANQLEALRGPEPSYFEPVLSESQPSLHEELVLPKRLGQTVEAGTPGFTELKDTLINDIPLRLFIPHHATMTLHLGRVDMADSNLVYVAQAADVRADNGGIVGAFVLKGEPKAWGLSKKGFCASIDGIVTVGVAENSPLFEKATETGGYFFRQYPLVCDGQLVENEPKGKSVRRAICNRQGEIFMVQTGTEESFHDFAQALVDLGVDQAIYLVGSSAHGWAVDREGTRHEFGDLNCYTGRHRMPKNTSYIVWRRNTVDKIVG